MASESSSSVRWLPLEANPDVLSGFVHKLGVAENCKLVDVLGIDDELLEMVPKPVIGVLLLFPISEKYEEYCKSKEDEGKEKGDGGVDTDKVYFMKQTIGNACGTIALIHAVGNNLGNIKLDEGSILGKFFDATKDKSPSERGEHLEKDERFSSVHSEHALLGQTEAPSIEEKLNLHFLAIVNVDGQLYELDGRKPFPVKCGSTSAETFLPDAVKVCKEYMDRDPSELRFSLVALTTE